MTCLVSSTYPLSTVPCWGDYKVGDTKPHVLGFLHIMWVFLQCPIVWPMGVESKETEFWLYCPPIFSFVLHSPQVRRGELPSHHSLNYLYPTVYKESLWWQYWEGNKFIKKFSFFIKPSSKGSFVLMDSKTRGCLWHLKLNNVLFVLGGPCPSWNTEFAAFMGGGLQENQIDRMRYAFQIHSEYIIYSL